MKKRISAFLGMVSLLGASYIKATPVKDTTLNYVPQKTDTVYTSRDVAQKVLELGEEKDDSIDVRDEIILNFESKNKDNEDLFNPDNID